MWNENLPVEAEACDLEWTGLGSKRKAGGGGKCSKLPIEEAFVLVIDEVLRIGGGGFWVCIEPRLNRVLRIVPVPMAVEIANWISVWWNYYYNVDIVY